MHKKYTEKVSHWDEFNDKEGERNDKGNCNIMALIINIIPRPCSINYGVFIN